jgi:hypothetical protein
MTQPNPCPPQGRHQDDRVYGHNGLGYLVWRCAKCGRTEVREPVRYFCEAPEIPPGERKRAATSKAEPSEGQGSHPPQLKDWDAPGTDPGIMVSVEPDYVGRQKRAIEAGRQQAPPLGQPPISLFPCALHQRMRCWECRP